MLHYDLCRPVTHDCDYISAIKTMLELIYLVFIPLTP